MKVTSLCASALSALALICSGCGEGEGDNPEGSQVRPTATSNGPEPTATAPPAPSPTPAPTSNPTDLALAQMTPTMRALYDSVLALRPVLIDGNSGGPMPDEMFRRQYTEPLEAAVTLTDPNAAVQRNKRGLKYLEVTSALAAQFYSLNRDPRIRAAGAQVVALLKAEYPQMLASFEKPPYPMEFELP